MTNEKAIETFRRWEKESKEFLADPETRCTDKLTADLNEQIELCEVAIAALDDSLNIRLPVPIGGPIYIPYSYVDTDGTINKGVEELILSGFRIDKNGQAYYIYDAGGEDIEIERVYSTFDAAFEALQKMEATS